MLATIKIKNFKCIKDEIELSFVPAKKKDEEYLTVNGILRLSYIFGPNGSGKSTIIEALKLLKTLADGFTVVTKPFRFVQADKINPVTSFEIILDNGFYYYIELNGSHIIYEQLCDIFSRAENDFKLTDDIAHLKPHLPPIDGQTSLISILKQFAPDIEEVAYFYSHFFERIRTKPTYKADKELVLHTLAMLDTRITDYNKYYVTIDSKYHLSISDLSCGMRKIFDLAHLINEPDKIILIDGIDDFLHPDIVATLITLFLQKEDSSQLICATHQRELLQLKDLYRPDCVWFIELKWDTKATQLYSLVDFQPPVKDPYKAYKFGQLGGVPKVLYGNR